jgi:UDP-N-acetylglucosamine acyltransferase
VGAADLIHPTALVDAKARLGGGVTIGAFAIVGPEVTLADGVEIGHHVVLVGRVEIGPGARIGHGAIIGGEPQDFKFKPGTPSGVRIGAGTIVREYATIHRASHDEAWTEIGPECLLMALSHVAHDCRLGRRVIVINYAGITGHCEIGDFVTIGGYAGIVPFTRVGAYAYVGGCSKLTADLPPFMIADGNPATVRGVNVVGMRRAGIPPADRRLVRDAHRLLYRSGLAPGRGLERLRTEIPPAPVRDMLVDFVAGTRRGLCPPSAGGWADAASPAADADSEPGF